MYKERFTIQEIDEKVSWTEGSEDPNIEYDEGLAKAGDIQDAMSALDSNSWDNIDWSSDEILCYPADGSINYRTGEETRTTVVIKGSERYIHWLNNLYQKKEKR